MLVKIPKIRFKLTEKERNLTWNSDNNLNQHQQTRCCQSKQGNNILSTTGHENEDKQEVFWDRANCPKSFLSSHSFV